MIYKLLLFVIAAGFSVSTKGQEFQLSSPDGAIDVEVVVDERITWEVSLNGNSVVLPSSLALNVDNRILGENPRLRSDKRRSVNETIEPVVAIKSKTIQDHYNELVLEFRDNYAVAFRAYNDGVAYRFQTSERKDITVVNEVLELNFPQNAKVLFPEEESFYSHYERLYVDTALAAISEERFASLPAVVTTQDGVRVLISESDLFDYPNMFIKGTGSNGLKATFPKVVLEATALPGGRPDRDAVISREADYIAKTEGRRNFPWRAFVITKEDGKLVESQLMYKLARPNQLENTDWIMPGKVAWDWYNANNIFGVDFRAGLNTKTYKYYIDFAAEYDLDYIILDEGWSISTTDLTAPNPDMDVVELVKYGESKGVGVILWMLWEPLDKNLEPLLDKFAQWGAKGIKVDFMQRADQEMVNYYERVSREAAKRQLIVDFHGSFKPAGQHRAYPNVLSHEGVAGLEKNKWSHDITPDHNLNLPFIRMAAGPMDYTPGAVVNANLESFRDIFDTPMSMGTRCHQVAMYVVYESPLQMLADNPSRYYREPETTEFISRMPVTWDETRVLQASIGDYILITRKKYDKWYVGAMTDWTPREFTLDCSFLDEGSYTITIMQDGINADRNANDYKKLTKTINRSTKLNLKLAPGGGWAAIIEKQPR